MNISSRLGRAVRTGSVASAIAIGTLPALGHSASTAWMTLREDGAAISGRWEIPLRDLDDALGLDDDDDGRITWGELRAHHDQIARYAFGKIALRADGRMLPPRATGHRVSERDGVPCAVIDFSAATDRPVQNLALEYHLFADRDPLHRGLVRFRRAGDASSAGTTAVLGPGHPGADFSPGAGTTVPGFVQFVREGVHHIWTGYDHLMFLLALLLPSVLRRGPGGWEPSQGLRASSRNVFQVVTAFTVAHSLTLGLAATGVVRLPSRLVESTIAVSIVVAALANLWSRDSAVRPRRPFPPWAMPFAFGLVHGFGFAGALGELGLSRTSLAVPLLGFNLGVELGQLACVAVFLPVASALRASRFYRAGVLPIGSVAILLLAGGWFVERVFEVRFLPF